MKQKHFNLIIDWTVVFISILLVGFVAVKASVTSFVHDESLTYNLFVNQSWHNIIFSNPVTANNHIFNTILMKLSQICFGTSELALRLPNVLAFVGFLVFLILILKKTGNRLLGFAFFILIVGNPYLLDFFALARGYGLGLCFMSGALYFLIRFLTDEKPKQEWFVLYFSFLAVWSNFVFLNFFIALLIVLNLIFLLDHESFRQYRKSKLLFDWLRFNRANLVSIFLLFLLIFEPIKNLIRYNQLYDGGTQGFLHDTISSLSKGIFYQLGSHSPMIEIINWLIVVFVLIVGSSLFYMLFQKRSSIQDFPNKVLFVFGGILLLIIVEIQIGHFLFGMKYLRNRTGLFFIPLLLLASYLSFVFLTNHFRVKKILLSFIFILVAIVIYHASYSLDINSYYEWKYDQNTKRMLSVLKQDVLTKHENEPVSLGISWVFEPTINFYRDVDSLSWLNKVDRDGIKATDDYIYILESDSNSINMSEYRRMRYFEDTQSILLKKIIQ